MGQTKLVDVYCIDSSALLDLKKRYPQDISTFAPIWKKLNELARNEQLISHSQVYKEIRQVRDEIYAWCRQHKNIFRRTSPEQIRTLKQVEQKYESHVYMENLNKPGPWADPWIISLAICERGIVIADENNQKNKIPFVSDALGVKCIDLVRLFRELGL